MKETRLPNGFASPHGSRTICTNEATRAKNAVEPTKRVTLSRSRDQAVAYYHELDLAKMLTTMLGREAPTSYALENRPLYCSRTRRPTHSRIGLGPK